MAMVKAAAGVTKCRGVNPIVHRVLSTQSKDAGSGASEWRQGETTGCGGRRVTQQSERRVGTWHCKNTIGAEAPVGGDSIVLTDHFRLQVLQRVEQG